MKRTDSSSSTWKWTHSAVEMESVHDKNKRSGKHLWNPLETGRRGSRKIKNERRTKKCAREQLETVMLRNTDWASGCSAVPVVSKNRSGMCSWDVPNMILHFPFWIRSLICILIPYFAENQLTPVLSVSILLGFWGPVRIASRNSCQIVTTTGQIRFESTTTTSYCLSIRQLPFSMKKRTLELHNSPRYRVMYHIASWRRFHPNSRFVFLRTHYSLLTRRCIEGTVNIRFLTRRFETKTIIWPIWGLCVWQNKKGKSIFTQRDNDDVKAKWKGVLRNRLAHECDFRRCLA